MTFLVRTHSHPLTLTACLLSPFASFSRKLHLCKHEDFLPWSAVCHIQNIYRGVFLFVQVTCDQEAAFWVFIVGISSLRFKASEMSLLQRSLFYFIAGFVMRHHSARHANESLFVIQDADRIEAQNWPKWVADWLHFTLNFYIVELNSFFTFQRMHEFLTHGYPESPERCVETEPNKISGLIIPVTSLRLD